MVVGKMNKFKQKSEQKNTVLQAALAGGISGAFTRAVAQPLDVLKIRFQLQLEPIDLGSKYSSMFQAVTSIVKEEGVFTLWSGHVPAQLLSISYGVAQFSSFEKLTQLAQRSDQDFFNAHRNSINFSNGAVAAMIATMVSYPFDTVRTRLIAEQKKKKVYNGFLHACSHMVKNEGPTALFKGLTPTLGQIAPHAGVQFAVYKFLTDNMFIKMKHFQREATLGATLQAKIESSFVANLLAGSIAGYVAKTVIYPFDLVKKRLQIQGFQQHRTSFGRQMYCCGVLHCIKLIINEEGYLALFKGYWPSVLKSILVSALHFAVYDEARHLLKVLS